MDRQRHAEPLSFVAMTNSSPEVAELLSRCALRDRDAGATERLVLLGLAEGPADVTGYEPVHLDGHRIGYVTSGAYGHHVGQSLALAYVQRGFADSDKALSVTVVGEQREARILREPPFDPAGHRLRG